MDKKELLNRTLADLRKLAARLKVPGRSKMSKRDLVETLRATLNKSAAPGRSASPKSGGGRRRAGASSPKKKEGGAVDGKTGRQRVRSASGGKGRTEASAGTAGRDTSKGSRGGASSTRTRGRKAETTSGSGSSARSSRRREKPGTRGKGASSRTSASSGTGKKRAGKGKAAPSPRSRKSTTRTSAGGKTKSSAKKKTVRATRQRRGGGADSPVHAAGLVPTRRRRPRPLRRPPLGPPPAVQAASSRQPGLEPGRELPLGYGENRIALMVRDPYWLFCYWELTDEQRLRRRESINGEKKLILRVYDVTGIEFDGKNANRYLDIDVPDQPVGNWYINVWGSGVTYLVDIGYLGEKGKFVPVARSNSVRTPSDDVSDKVDAEWAVVDEDYEEIVRVAGGADPGASSGDIKELLAKRMQGELSSWGGSPGPSVPGSIGASVGGSVGASVGASVGGSVGASPGGSPGGSPGEAGGERLPVLPGRAGHDLSAAAAGQTARDRQFWLVVNTELIVYGATEPDASLKVQGVPIELRPDGTFSLRFALPDGKQVIPVEATSSDEVETRVITPVVEKYTE